MSPASGSARCAARRLPRRQIRARIRPRLSDRRPGAGPPADAAAPARRAGRAQHRRLRLRLSRLAAGRARPWRCGRRRSSSSRAHIKFQPGLNEDLAATAIWGTQQVNLYPGAKYDGVFAMWYGKGPGVDRCGDVFKHANFAGTSKHGGVLVLAGDDHAAKSSTLPHQSDHQFSAAMMPVLYPSSVQEIIDLGLHGWAMSRYSGCWVGFKCVSDTVESSASVYIDPDRVEDHRARTIFRCRPTACRSAGPTRSSPPKRGCRTTRSTRRCTTAASTSSTASSSTRPSRGSASSPAARAISTCARRSTTSASPRPTRAEIGIRVFKVAMPWPLEPEGVRHFAEGPRGNPGRRGKAPDRRIPAEGAALQLARRRAPARGRQVRRKGRVDASARRLAAAGDVASSRRR